MRLPDAHTRTHLEASRDEHAPADNDVRQAVEAAAAAHVGIEGNLLPVLQAVQEALGHIPRPAVIAVAEALNASIADVHGVVSFYPDLRTEPPGRTVVRLCIAEACQAVGSRHLVEQAESRLGLLLGTTAPDASLTLESVACLGTCSLGPSAQVNGVVHGRMDADRLVRLVEQAGS